MNNFFIKLSSESLSEAISNHWANYGYSTVELAELDAYCNLEIGEKFEIVDREGNVYFKGQVKYESHI